MVVHKLSLDSFEEAPYCLLAIHTSLEDYHLAFLINQKLPILLSRNKKDISIITSKSTTYFSRFTYENLKYETFWDLVQNKNHTDLSIVSAAQKSNPNLFEVPTSAYLLSDFKKVDYILRVQGLEVDFETLIKTLKDISRIESIYLIHEDQIKSKNNLIF